MKRKSRQTTLFAATTISTSQPSSADVGECPVCGKEYPVGFLSSHVSFHFDDASPVKQPRASSPHIKPQPASPLSPATNVSAFDVLRSAQKKLQDRLVVFRLDIVDHKILPVVCTNEVPFSEEHIQDAWTAEISMKQVTSQTSTVFPRCKLRLCTNVSPATHVLSTNVALIPAKANNAGTIAILKSMIQKAFRRRRAAEAGRLALYLCRISIDECLRRILIIMIEDGALHIGYPVIVWCMMAQSKGYLLPDVLLSACISIFVEAAHSSISDYPMSSVTSPDFSVDMTGSVKTLIHSVLFRAAYGGMAHDIVLLVDAANQCMQRYAEREEVNEKLSHKYLHSDYLGDLQHQPDLEQLLCLRMSPPDDSITLSQLFTELYNHLGANLTGSTTEGVFALLTLQLAASDLIIEGIDHIADRQLVPHIVSRLHQNAEFESWRNLQNVEDTPRVVEQCIGTFRSFVNVRREHRSLDTTEVSRRLQEKKFLSGLWRLICPMVKEYCSKRLADFAKSLRLRA